MAKKTLAIKTPAYDTEEFPKIPWGAVARLDLFGGRLDPNFRAGKYEGEAGAEGKLIVTCNEGDVIQYGLRHKSGDREKSQNSGYYRVVDNDGTLELGEKMDAKEAREALKEDRKNGIHHPDEKARGAGTINWIVKEYFDGDKEAAAAACEDAATKRTAREEAAAKAKAEKEAATEPDATGEAEPGW